jgi:hypothetical protein
MDTSKTPRKRRLVRTPTGPHVAAFIHGHWISMRVDKLGRATMFLVSPSFVSIYTVVQLHVHLNADEAPLRMMVSVTYVERTRAGYGLGVHVSSTSNEDQARWNSYLASVPSIGAETMASCSHVLPVPSADLGGLRVVGDALSKHSIDSLRAVGIDVLQAETMDHVAAKVRDENVSMVIVDESAKATSGFEWCGQLRRIRPSLRPVVLVSGRKESEFEAALQSGASLVIGVSSSQKLMNTRLHDHYMLAPSVNEEAAVSRSQQGARARSVEPTIQATQSSFGELWRWTIERLGGSRHRVRASN